MHKIYENWPELAEEYYLKDLKKIKLKKISHIVFTGMGGSGAIGDIFKSILSKTSIHVTIVKGYTIPKTVDNKTLVIPISISGNTVETISTLKLAHKKRAKILAITSGGKMKNFCLENKIDLRIINMEHSPRASFTIFLYSMLNILEPILPIDKLDILKSINDMKKLRQNIFSQNVNEENNALKLATWIKNIPIIYYPYGLESVAVRFKNSLQENAKIHCMIEDIIETGHNGIESWENKSKINPIFIIGSNDHHKTKERWIIMEKFFIKKNIDFYKIKSINGGILTKIINLIYFFDYVSIYYAIIKKTDPSPVKSIEYIKENIKK